MSQRAVMSQELERSAGLIERMLADPELRRRFRADPAAVLRAHGLYHLATELGGGEKALRTLELRESRSSLAGAMVAAAAEGVDLVHLAGHVAPALEHNAGRALDRLMRSLSRHGHPAPAARTAKPSLGPAAPIPRLAPAGPEANAGSASGAGSSAAVGPAAAGAAGGPVAGDAGAQGAAEQGAGAQGAAAQGAGAQGAAAQGADTAAGGAVGAHSGAAQGDQAAAAASAQASAAASAAAEARAGAAARAAAGGAAGRAPHDAAGSPIAAGDHASHHHHHHHHHHGDHAGVDPGSETQDLLRYPGAGATPQRIAAWMGAHAVRAGLPPELPVMAALTESNMHNLPYGDRDSVGFFQMRLGIWNHGPYRGYPDHPRLQLRWFIDHALAVRAGNPAVAASANTWGDWIAEVEQPAAQYRYRYALQLDNARELLQGVAFDQMAQATPLPVGNEALDVALHYLGVPYKWGGSSPAAGFDCSGLVQYAYAQAGIPLPRVAADQFHVGIPVPRHDLKPGDAVFFADPSGYVHHVGLYIGDGHFINAPQTGENVSVASLSDPYFASQYAGARRYIAAALGDSSRWARSLPVVRS